MGRGEREVGSRLFCVYAMNLYFLAHRCRFCAWLTHRSPNAKPQPPPSIPSNLTASSPTPTLLPLLRSHQAPDPPSHLPTYNLPPPHPLLLHLPPLHPHRLPNHPPPLHPPPPPPLPPLPPPLPPLNHQPRDPPPLHPLPPRPPPPLPHPPLPPPHPPPLSPPPLHGPRPVDRAPLRRRHRTHTFPPRAPSHCFRSASDTRSHNGWSGKGGSSRRERR